ncbi:MAG: tetratricopeptide (TPR) repeat protein, partial [Pirellulaceae bacterium]
MKNRMVVAAILLLIALIPSFANGDAASDLAEGRVALQNAKLNDALPLLTSAAQALPNSVEAHIALAECLIRLGEIDRALIEYRQVAKLSPQHEFANEMIKTLTARHTNSEKQFATAKTFAQLGEFNKSIEILHSVYHSFSDSEKRDDIRLLVAEYRLWAGQNDQAATEAMLVAQQSEEPALTATARAIAAVALASVPAKAKRILAGVNIPVAWANRVKLIDTFELLEDSNQAVAAAKSLIGALADVPQSPFRTALQVHVLRIQLSNIELAVSRNEIQRALEIAWPMLSNKALPQADAFLKPIALEGGWVENDRVTRQSIAKSLLEIGQRFAFAQTDVNEDRLLPLWITSEVYRQISNDQNTVNDRLNIASLLEQLSRPAENRKRNDPLSPADAMQFSLLHDVADQLNIAQIDTLVTIVLSQVSRYRAADDWKNGLSKFVAIDLKADPPQAKLVGNFANLRHGLQRINLSHGLASNYVSLGDQLRANSRNSVLATPLDAVNPADITALALFRQSADFPQREKESREAAHRIVDQYASASQWKLAEECLDIYYATQRGDDLAWKKIQLTTQQIAARENDLLSARRGIGDALAPTIENVLSQIDTLLAARPTKQ